MQKTIVQVQESLATYGHIMMSYQAAGSCLELIEENAVSDLKKKTYVFGQHQRRAFFMAIKSRQLIVLYTWCNSVTLFVCT